MGEFDSLKSVAKSTAKKLEAIKPDALKAQLEQTVKKYEDELKDTNEIPDLAALKARIAATKADYIAYKEKLKTPEGKQVVQDFLAELDRLTAELEQKQKAAQTAARQAASENAASAEATTEIQPSPPTAKDAAIDAEATEKALQEMVDQEEWAKNLAAEYKLKHPEAKKAPSFIPLPNAPRAQKEEFWKSVLASRESVWRNDEKISLFGYKDILNMEANRDSIVRRLTNSIKVLDKDTAEILVMYNPREEYLCLDGVETITADVANILVSGDKIFSIYLLGLKKVDPDTFRVLMKNGRFNVGLAEPNAELIKIYKEENGSLNTNLIKKLDAPAAAELTKHDSQWGLYLGGLTTLTVEVAAELAKSKSGLYLSGLTTLTVEAVAELAKHEGYLSLNGLITLTVEAAAELAKHEGYLSLNGLKTLTVEAAAELAKHEGGLSLNGLTTLTKDAAAELAKHEGYLHLSGLTTLTVEAVAELAKHEGYLSLNGLTTLTVDVAAELAKSKSELYLSGLTTLTVEAAAELAKHEGGLYLNGLKTLTKDAAAELAKHKGYLDLNGLKTLTVDVAAELAKHKGYLDLNGLKTLTKDAAAELAKHKGKVGTLNLNEESLKIWNEQRKSYLEKMDTQLDKKLSDLAEKYGLKGIILSKEGRRNLEEVNQSIPRLEEALKMLSAQEKQNIQHIISITSPYAYKETIFDIAYNQSAQEIADELREIPKREEVDRALSDLAGRYRLQNLFLWNNVRYDSSEIKKNIPKLEEALKMLSAQERRNIMYRIVLTRDGSEGVLGTSGGGNAFGIDYKKSAQEIAEKLKEASKRGEIEFALSDLAKRYGLQDIFLWNNRNYNLAEIDQNIPKLEEALKMLSAQEIKNIKYRIVITHDGSEGVLGTSGGGNAFGIDYKKSAQEIANKLKEVGK